MFGFEELSAKINRLKRDGGVGYTTGQKTVILPEQTVTVNEEIGGYVLDFAPVAGKVYTVTVDGVEYKCEAKSTTMEGAEIIVLGNGFMFGVQGNGEPWYIAYTAVYQMCAFGWEEYKETDPTISIYEGEETIHPIDPKYLPSGGGGGLKIDMADYGVELFQLFAVAINAGTSQFTIDNEAAYRFENTLRANEGPVTLVIKNNSPAAYVEVPCTKIGKNSEYYHSIGAVAVLGFNAKAYCAKILIDTVDFADSSGNVQAIVKLAVEEM